MLSLHMQIYQRQTTWRSKGHVVGNYLGRMVSSRDSRLQTRPELQNNIWLKCWQLGECHSPWPSLFFLWGFYNGRWIMDGSTRSYITGYRSWGYRLTYSLRSGFNVDDVWGHRASEPNKAVVCSLALARLRNLKTSDGEVSPAANMAQKLILFWRKPAVCISLLPMGLHPILRLRGLLYVMKSWHIGVYWETCFTNLMMRSYRGDAGGKASNLKTLKALRASWKFGLDVCGPWKWYDPSCNSSCIPIISC